MTITSPFAITPSSSSANPYNLPPLKDRLVETFNTYFKFGYTTFGGPSAHIAILYDEIVAKRQWLSSEQFTELFAICQALPGPASTELAFSLSLVRSGFLCSVVSFLLWSIPGAIVMTVSGILIGSIKDEIPLWATRLEQGLATAAIGLVALAAYRMSTALATDKLTRILALVAGSVSALYTAPWLLPVMMIAGGIVSYIYDGFWTPFLNNCKEKRKEHQESKEELQGNDLEKGNAAKESESSQEESAATEGEQGGASAEKRLSTEGSIRNRGSKAEIVIPEEPMDDIKMDSTTRKAFSYSKKLGFVFFLVFLALLIAAVLVRALISVPPRAEYAYIVSTFYFVGSIIFGGGPVIIPLLKTYTVDSGWMTDQQFLVGLALIQSLPGPNFNFACFLGAVAMVNAGKNGVAGAILCYLAIFFPGLILKNAIIPFWQFVREHKSVKMVFRGVNACALGLVFSATWLLWIQTNSMGGSSGYHAVIASVAFVAAGYLDIPAPLVIIIGGGMGAIEYAVSDR
ncbi:chromate transporter-domain-containing protein [Gamsiella multidivaricata]|uniref:chromate transporter-domain-containing protein n=1 Tax=Gamsiella multidivaricata TaxID=101098 RepID=UPI00221E9B41|nr:chromate transporter-domain-containing protein [Gamsiella multidivaricata]KAG0362570.1 hypothetical protein BGZ54_008574 [Gamsiella multidivaricata]KAI7817738.1 chromate transporter-domain-containing protein [Gamsiella multidivaricata]